MKHVKWIFVVLLIGSLTSFVEKDKPPEACLFYSNLFKCIIYEGCHSDYAVWSTCVLVSEDKTSHVV